MKSLPLNSNPLAHLLFGKILYPWLTVVHLYKVYRPGLSFCFQLYLIIWKMWTRSLLGVGLLLGAFLFDESQVINSKIWPLPVLRGAIGVQRANCHIGLAYIHIWHMYLHLDGRVKLFVEVTTRLKIEDCAS